MEEFKIGDTVTTYKKGRKIESFPERGRIFKVSNIYNIDGTSFLDSIDSLGVAQAARCKLVHREEEFKIGDWVKFARGPLSETFKVSRMNHERLFGADEVSVFKINCRHASPVEVLDSLKGETDNQLRPDHYGGKDNPYECIKVIRAWNLSFELSNVLKYINRTGKKDDAIQDLEKAKTYIDMEIEKLKAL